MDFQIQHYNQQNPYMLMQFHQNILLFKNRVNKISHKTPALAKQFQQSMDPLIIFQNRDNNTTNIIIDMSLLKPGKMPYRYFGNSGLSTSVISLGNMINSNEENYQIDEEVIRVALAHGINHFDTAEVYHAGKAEIQLGKILKNLKVPREEVIIATKIRIAPEPDMNSTLLLNRKHIKQSLEGSLKRLQLDYVDILYAHLFEDLTPLQEIVRGFHEVIESGKVFYWATSNWDSESVLAALAICERLNLHKPIGAQNEYNMLNRSESQIQYLSLYKNYKYGLVAWSPLAGGYLTGKYLNGISETEVNRYNDKKGWLPVQVLKTLFFDQKNTEQNLKNVKELSDFAEKELDCKLTHLALAWVIKYQHVDSALIGARNAAQLQDSLKALDVLEKLTPQLEGRINKILNNTPNPRLEMKAWKPYPTIRPVAL